MADPHPAATASTNPATSRAPNPSPEAATGGRGAGQRLKGWIDSLLVADVFVVIAGALWFAVAVLCHSRGVEAPLRLFQRLWEPLFTPAIGLLMAAALLSGVLGWCLRWWQRRAPR